MMDHDFADDLRGPDPDRFNWYPFAIAAATLAVLLVLCAALYAGRGW